MWLRGEFQSHTNVVELPLSALPGDNNRAVVIFWIVGIAPLPLPSLNGELQTTFGNDVVSFKDSRALRGGLDEWENGRKSF